MFGFGFKFSLIFLNFLFCNNNHYRSFKLKPVFCLLEIHGDAGGSEVPLQLADLLFLCFMQVSSYLSVSDSFIQEWGHPAIDYPFKGAL